jgi:imidazolonepropionase-like amidohydrolase
MKPQSGPRGRDGRPELAAGSVTSRTKKPPRNLGQLAPGFRADVVAVPGDPLADISLTSKVGFVMKDGTVFVGAGAK